MSIITTKQILSAKLNKLIDDFEKKYKCKINFNYELRIPKNDKTAR